MKRKNKTWRSRREAKCIARRLRVLTWGGTFTEWESIVRSVYRTKYVGHLRPRLSMRGVDIIRKVRVRVRPGYLCTWEDVTP